MTVGSGNGLNTGSSIWRRLCTVNGIPTELLGVDATAGPPRLQAVVFPGNPGSAAYFRPFMASLHEQLGGQADVLAVTHAGHDPDIDTGGKLWDLSQQIAHKVAFLRQHVLLPGRPPVLLVGHSIGAAMAIKAVVELEGLTPAPSGASAAEAAPAAATAAERPTAAAATAAAAGPAATAAAAASEEAYARGAAVPGASNPLAASPLGAEAAAAVLGPPSPFLSQRCADGEAAAGGASAGEVPPILKVVAVFPFFETNFPGNARQRRLRALAPWHEALGWVGAAVTSLLPQHLRLAFVRLNAAMDPEAVELTCRLLSRNTVRNAFFLAGHEFKELSRPWEWGLLAALGGRLHVMGCEADTWMSRSQFDDMCARLPGLQATWHPDLRHAFCVSHRQSAAVASVVASIAQPILLAAMAPTLPADADVDTAAAAAAAATGGAARRAVSASPSAASVSHAPDSDSPSSTTTSSSSASVSSASLSSSDSEADGDVAADENTAICCRGGAPGAGRQQRLRAAVRQTSVAGARGTRVAAGTAAAAAAAAGEGGGGDGGGDGGGEGAGRAAPQAAAAARRRVGVNTCGLERCRKQQPCRPAECPEHGGRGKGGGVCTARSCGGRRDAGRGGGGGGRRCTVPLKTCVARFVGGERCS